MIIIPARLASSRFPNKILCDIGGVPMFIKSAQNAQAVDEVVLALDSTEAYNIAKQYKIKAVLTHPDIPNGSLRVLEAARILGLNDDCMIINLQADEPFLEHHVIQALKDCMQPDIFMATCAKSITAEQAQNPNLVKVITNHLQHATYFSRAAIPFCRDCNESMPINYLGHLGLYGFFKATLEEYANLPETQLEQIEKLEQLRAIHYNKPIKIAHVESESIGIDTEEDLENARNKYGF